MRITFTSHVSVIYGIVVYRKSFGIRYIWISLPASTLINYVSLGKNIKQLSLRFLMEALIVLFREDYRIDSIRHLTHHHARAKCSINASYIIIIIIVIVINDTEQQQCSSSSPPYLQLPLQFVGTMWLLLANEMWGTMMCVTSRLRQLRDSVISSPLSPSLLQ